MNSVTNRMKQKAVYHDYTESAAYIHEKIDGKKIDCAIVLGSGLGEFAESLQDKIVIRYADIPHFPVSTVSYQKGEMVFGTYGGKNVLAMNGRFHYYEGWEMWQTAYYVFTLSLLEVTNLIITNAAGGVGEKLHPGLLVRVTDHIKLDADSPLRGANLSQFGERFFDMQSVYDKELGALAHRCAEKLNIPLAEGVYAYMGGPQYETPAEIRMLRIMGADLVGMSTVPEVIAAAQCKIRVLCISCVTNMAAGITGNPITEEEVLETGAKVHAQFKDLVGMVIENL